MFIMLFITSHHTLKNLSIIVSVNLYFFQRFLRSHTRNENMYRTSHITNSSSNFQDIQFMFSTTLFIINLRVLQNKFCMKKKSVPIPIDLIWCSVWYHLAYQCTIKEGPLFLTIAYTYKIITSTSTDSKKNSKKKIFFKLSVTKDI